MIELCLPEQKAHSLQILCLGSHSDDIEIGCGGTILNLIQRYPSSNFRWVVFSSNDIRKKEAEKSAKSFLSGAAGKTVSIHQFKDGFFPYIGSDIKEYFEQLKQKIAPDLILTHYRRDLHQDHRVISDLTWNTFRDHLILEYEIPKYDGDLGSPNVFVHVDQGIVEKKLQYILDIFESQAANQWFKEETFRSVLRLRGIESNSHSGYAEGFYCRKLTLR